MGQTQGKDASSSVTAAGAGAGSGKPPPPCGYGEGGGSNESAPCPVDLGPSTSGSSPVYNVYNQRIDQQVASSEASKEEAKFRSIWNLGWGGRGTGTIDSKNNMPLEANQQPSVGQRKALSISREKSSIPKGGTQSTWQYPSPQMFFNALNRKGKADGVDEEDMENVVFFHNGMNERTWELVKRWESLHSKEYEGNKPKLARFLGRPHDLSPMARMRSVFYGETPFDRHDWYVDRNGEEVRYVIDFYFDEEKAGTMEAFEVHARPALDSMTAGLDRLKMNIYETCAKYGLPCPISGHPPPPPQH
ncbi:cytochrome c heme lyase [Chloropicon primus]|uniref:Holocytochrome c-type synthase n=2 Tax=Chloropicon primus TaxID=1764295 RepID=A0A5B8MWV0_9CHLO|nr:cytochrome c heme lyase [Chloropicon primus]UPR03854.1 cytochrome c heme lyase [Chloropicon primus]|eukprot:QDZ24646.1 cytochrome c heme lyase [Chloropicon primus]